MTRPYLGNPQYTIEVLQKYDFVFQKRFGQNFLIDTHVLEVILICVTAFIGICCLSASLEGYLMAHMPWYQRLLALVGGLMLIFPGTVTDLGGVALALIVVALQFFTRRQSLATA